MKDKVLVRLKLPMAGIHQDVRLPADETLAELLPVLTALIQATVSAPLPLQSRPMLWNAKNGTPLSGSKTLREQGIHDSDLLFLI